MKKTGVKLTGLAAGAFLYAFAAPVLAEDDTAANQAAQNAPAPVQTKPADAKDAKKPADPKAAEKAKSEKEAAVQTVPAWESYGGPAANTVEEEFFRLSRDFVTTSENGFKMLGSVPIWPRGDIKVGGIRIAPFIREAVEWTDNYYDQTETGNDPNPNGEHHGKVSQWTHVNEVGALADTALAGGRLRLNATVDSIWNVNYDSTPDTWDFFGAFGATYRWDSGVWISGGISYERRHDPDDLPNLSDDFARHDVQTFFNLGFDRDVFFGTKIKWEFGVQTRTPYAEEDEYESMDRTEITAYAKASYPFWKETTRAFVRLLYTWENKNSDALNDGNGAGVDFGIEGSIPLRKGEYRGLRGSISMGFSSAHYEDDTYQRGSSTLKSDTDSDRTTLNVQAALQYLISPKSSADLRYLHAAEFSFYGNYQIVDRVDLTFSHNFTRQLTARVGTFWEHVDPSGDNPPDSIPPNDFHDDAHNYTRFGIGTGARYAVNEWADLDATVNYERNNDHSDKSYGTYTATAGVTFYLNALTPKVRSAISR
jgi:hypothetical protein